MATAVKNKKTASSKPASSGEEKKVKPLKVAVITVGVAGGVGLLLFLGKKAHAKGSDKATDIVNSSAVNTITTITKPSVPSSNTGIISADSFPLKYGSFGENVKRLQRALNAKANPKLNDDGDFGTKTLTELQKQTGKTSVSLSDLLALETSAASNTNTSTSVAAPGTFVPLTSTQAAAIAEEIRKATYIRVVDDYGKNWYGLQVALRKIRNTKDYEAVNREYLKIGLVSKTIVTHLLSTYGQYNAYRQVLTAEFLRIGLKQNADGRWSISGLGNTADNRGRMVYTKAPIVVLASGEDNRKYSVREGTTLGWEMARDQNISTILTGNNMVIYAPSESLNYL